MPVEWTEGFDAESSNDVNYNGIKWDAPGYNTGAIGTGRFSGNCFTVSGGGTIRIFKTLPGGAQATRVIGIAVKINATKGSPLFGFADGGTPQAEVGITADGHWTVQRNGTVLATSTQTYVVGTWYYLEFKATVGEAAGSPAGAYELRLWDAANSIEGTAILTASSVDTQHTANASANQLYIGGATPNFSYDDIYVASGFLGECRILTNMPTGDSATNKQWTPSTGTTHYTLVDEVGTNADTDYVSSSTPGQIDTFTFASVTIPGSILAVATNIVARKDDAGTRQICEECRSNSANYDGATKSLGSSYGAIQEIREKNPNTNLAWTNSELNAAEFGMKVVA